MLLTLFIVFSDKLPGTFSVGHCVVCSSSNRDSDYPFGILKIFLFIKCCFTLFFVFHVQSKLYQTRLRRSDVEDIPAYILLSAIRCVCLLRHIYFSNGDGSFSFLCSTTGVTCGDGTSNPSGAPEFTSDFEWIRVVRSLVFCVMFCIYKCSCLSVFSPFFSPLCCHEMLILRTHLCLPKIILLGPCCTSC